MQLFFILEPSIEKGFQTKESRGTLRSSLWELACRWENYARRAFVNGRRGKELRAAKREIERRKAPFWSLQERTRSEKMKEISFISRFLVRPLILRKSIDHMASSSRRRAERLRSLLSRFEALSADMDDALARCESDLGRAAALVAPTVARTQVSSGRSRWVFSSDDNLENLFPSQTPPPPPSSIRIPAREGFSAPHVTQRSNANDSHSIHLAKQPRKITSTKKQALRAARNEIRSSLATSEKALEHLDAARRLEPVVLAGPRGDNLDSFLMALSKLDEASAFLSKHKNGLVAAAAAAESVAALRSDGNALALRELEATMRGGQHLQQQQYQNHHQQRQRVGLTAEAAARTTRETAETTATTTAKTMTAVTQARLRSLARALVAGGGPEASSPSVVAFLSSEREAKR